MKHIHRSKSTGLNLRLGKALHKKYKITYEKYHILRDAVQKTFSSILKIYKKCILQLEKNDPANYSKTGNVRTQVS